MTKYRAGVDLERAAKAVLERSGYFVVRSGGSKGPVDLVALMYGEVLLVQCKLDGYLRPAERAELIRLARRTGATPIVARWEKTGRAARQVGFRVLTAAELVAWPGEGV